MSSTEAFEAEFGQLIEIEGLVVSAPRLIENGAEFVVTLDQTFLDFGQVTVQVPRGLAAFVMHQFGKDRKVTAEGEYHVFTDEAGDDSLVLEASSVGIIAERSFEL